MKKGITPIIAVIILLLITVALAGLASTFLSWYFSGMTAQSLQLVDYSCVNTNARVVVRNAGTSTINMASCSGAGTPSYTCSDMTVLKTTGNTVSGIGFGWSATSIPPSSLATFNDSCGSTTCTYRFTTTTGAGGPSPAVAIINC